MADSDDLKQLGKLLIADQEITAKLVASPDQETWINIVIEFAEGKGIKVTTQELIESLQVKASQRINTGTGKELIVALGHSPSSAATTPW